LELFEEGLGLIKIEVYELLLLALLVSSLLSESGGCWLVVLCCDCWLIWEPWFEFMPPSWKLLELREFWCLVLLILLLWLLSVLIGLFEL
jgi:hypothetical protein